MGREHKHDHNVTRGVVPAHKLLHHGVNCSLSSNNILNPFTPYGDCSQMRMANLYANICQVGKQADMRECFNMVTRRPAEIMRLTDYGLAVGKSADLVVLDSAEPGNGRRRTDAGALRLQARPQDRVAATRDAAPAAMIVHDPYNAFCRHTHVALDGAPDGPLRGLTFAAKDVFDIAGHRTGNGNPVWLETHTPAARTASAVERLLAAGASMVGKTHTDEMAYSLNGENVHYGTPTNPARAGADSRRIIERIGGRGRRRPRRLRARHRLRRLGAPAG